MFTPLREGLGQLNYSKIRRKVLECFSKNNYELLEKELQNFSKPQLEDFFAREGRILLKHAIDQSNSKAITFIIDNIPSTTVKEVLSKDNFSILKQFLGGESMMEKHGYSNEKTRKLMVEKFNILLCFDQDGITDFIKNSEINKEHYLTPAIKEDLFTVLELSNKSDKKY